MTTGLNPHLPSARKYNAPAPKNTSHMWEFFVIDGLHHLKFILIQDTYP